MTVIVAVLLGLLGSLGATARALSTGRQRTVAVSLAKQAIERLQGAAYTDVATNLASPGLTTDPMVSGTTPNLMFEGEYLVAGSATPYLATAVEAGTTFTMRTFVTAVTPATGTAYRRVTLIIGWNPTSTTSGTDQRSMRFSSLIFPLDYTSYPSSSGTAEATGGSVTVTGTLGGDVFDELRLALPGAHASTDSSTLRTAIGTAASATSAVDVDSGAVTSSTCPAYGDGSGRQCPRESAASGADNDSGTNTGGSATAVSKPFSNTSNSTPGGITVLTPSGTMTSRAIVGACPSSCGLFDSDSLPWGDASLVTTSAASLTFQVDPALGGMLWKLESGWSPSAQTDHDVDGGGVVNAAAQIVAPQARVFDLVPGQAPAGFEGAVRLSGFTASASSGGGYTTAEPAAPSGVVDVQLWDGSGYRTVSVTPGVSADHTAVATFAVGSRTVAFTSRVQSQPKTTSISGSAPRTSGVAQHTSLLLVTVVVTVTTGATAQTFTIVFDYGRVSALSTWLVEPA